MAKGICGWCGTLTHLTPYGHAWNVPHPPNEPPAVQCAMRCDDCLTLSMATLWGGPDIAHPTDANTIANYWTVNSPDSLAPVFVSGQKFHDVPQHIASAASEAHKCRSINALMASVLMARTVVEAVAKEKGVAKGTLFQKIDELGAQGTIKQFTVDTAHIIRTFGNDMAHGDITMPLDAEDADGVLGFMDQLLNEVFQNPAKLAALRARAAERA